MKARIVRYSFIGVVAVLIILCGMKFSNMYKDYQKLQFNQEQIDTQVSVLMSMPFFGLCTIPTPLIWARPKSMQMNLAFCFK